MENKEMIDKIMENPIIKEIYDNFEFKSYGSKPILVGGAILDILEGREPKDYDFLNDAEPALRTTLKLLGYKYSHESKTAITYNKGSVIVQILKTSIEDFEYTISQTRLIFKMNTPEFIIDKESFEGKVLVPIEFDRPFQAVRCLLRKPHWEKKGYNLPEETYYSLLNLVYKSGSRHS